MIQGAHLFPRQDAVMYGRPAAEAVRDLANRYGAKRLLILTTRSLGGPTGQAERLAQAIGSEAVGVFDGIEAHAPWSCVLAAAAAARQAKSELLVAFGGGSVIDAAKIVQLCLWANITTTEELGPYRSGRGADRRSASAIAPGIRMIAVPTTLSAAEFTAFAGATDDVRRVKRGFHHPDFAPRAVILDPAVTRATPQRLWSATGLKAVDHAVEQLCHRQRAPMGDAVAAEGLRLLSSNLPAVHAAPDDLEARALCQHGMWLSISGAASGRGMGASHAIGHTLGGSYGVPHGETSCVILPAVLTWNGGFASERQALVARLMGRAGDSAAAVVRDLAKSLNLPTRLSEVGIEKKDFDAIAAHAIDDPGVRSNPRPIHGPGDIVQILELAA